MIRGLRSAGLLIKRCLPGIATDRCMQPIEMSFREQPAAASGAKAAERDHHGMDLLILACICAVPEKAGSMRPGDQA